MNNLNVLILATAAILAAAWFANHQAEQQFETQDGELLLPELASQLGKVDSVVITAAGNETSTLNNVDGQWQLAERAGFPADINQLSKALRQLADAKTLEAKTTMAANYSKLGVQDVDLASDTTLRLTAKAGDEVLADLLIGKSGRGGNYVRGANDTQSWLIDQRISLSRNNADYLAKDLLKMPRNDVAEVSVTPLEGKPYGISKSDPNASDFELRPAAGKGKETNAANVNRLAAALGNLRINDVVDEPEGMQWSEASVRSFDGLQLALQLAKDDDSSNRYLKLTASMAPGYEQSLKASHAEAKAAEEPEKTEGAATEQPAAPPEASVEERVQQAQRRADTINAVAKGRVFVAPQYSVDALMMTYEMLQKDKPSTQDE